MGKLLVLYDTSTNHTGQMAEFVVEGAKSLQTDGKEPEMTVRSRHIDDAAADDVMWADGLALGSPTNLGVMSWKMKKWWDDRSEDLWPRVDGKIGCTFSSAGGYGGGAEMTCLSLTNLLMNFGFLVFGTTDYVEKRFTLHYGATVAKAPRATEEAEACRRLGLRLAEWVAYYVDGKTDLHPLLTTKKDGAWDPNSGFFDTVKK